VFVTSIRSDDDGVSTLVVTGELDLASAPEFRRALRTAEADGTVTVDLTGVAFIDSVGVGLLIGSGRRVHEAGGRLWVVVAAGRVRRLLVACRVDQLVGIVDAQ